MRPRDQNPFIACSTKQLPHGRQAQAERVSRAYGLHEHPPEATAQSEPVPGTRMRLSVLRGQVWPGGRVDLTVSFVDSRPRGLRTKILAHMNAWSEWGSIRFRETNGTGDVRIAFEGGDLGGYWSYVGTDILHIPEDEPTMNLEGFTERTEESEFRRVVRHETGHTLGFPHEHMRRELVDRIDPVKAKDYYLRQHGWSADEVERQVLTPLEERSIIGTSQPDQTSIMTYHVPGSLTIDGAPIPGGVDINSIDGDFVAKIYPKDGRERIIPAPPSQPLVPLTPGSRQRTDHKGADAPPSTAARAGHVLVIPVGTEPAYVAALLAALRE